MPDALATIRAEVLKQLGYAMRDGHQSVMTDLTTATKVVELLEADAVMLAGYRALLSAAEYRAKVAEDKLAEGGR